MADSGFDNGPPSKKSKTSPTSSITSFDPDTADLSSLLMKFNDELPAELGDPIPQMRTIDMNRKLDDTLQNNRHLSALLGMDLPMHRGPSYTAENPRLAQNVTQLQGAAPLLSGKGNWCVRPSNLHQYRISVTNPTTAADTLPLQPNLSSSGFVPGPNKYVGGPGGPLTVHSNLVRAATYPTQLTCTHNFKGMRVPVAQGAPSAFGNQVPSAGLLAIEKFQDDQLTNGLHSLSSGEMMKPVGASSLDIIQNQSYALPESRNLISNVITSPDMGRAAISRSNLGTPNLSDKMVTSAQVTTVPLQCDTTPLNSNTEKQRLILQQLVLIFHAHKCHRREQTNGIHQSPCPLPQCQAMKNVLRHMMTCSDGRSCRVPHCASSRQIIAHWRNCRRLDCPICSPLKSGSLRKSVGVPLPPPPPSSVPASTDSNMAYDFSPKPAIAVHPPPVASTDMSLTQASTGHLASSAVGNMANSSSSSTPSACFSPASSSCSSSYAIIKGIQSGFGEVDMTPVPGQDWRLTVTQDLRNHLVHKLVQAIFPTHEPTALKDPRMSSLVQYAKKVEGDMYEKARSREEYYHLLAEKIYKIQKELEVKKQRRINDQNGLKDVIARTTSTSISLSHLINQPSSTLSPSFNFSGDGVRSITGNSQLPPAPQILHPSASHSNVLDNLVTSPVLSRPGEVSGIQPNVASFNMLTGIAGNARAGDKTASYQDHSGSNQVGDVAQDSFSSRQLEMKQQLLNVLSKRCHQMDMMEQQQLRSDLMSPTSQTMTSSLRQPVPAIWGSNAKGNMTAAYSQADKSGVTGGHEMTYNGRDQFFSPGCSSMVPSSDSLIQASRNQLGDDTFGFESVSMSSLLSADVKVDIKHEDITDDEMAVKSDSVENSEGHGAEITSKTENMDVNVEIKLEVNDEEFGFTKTHEVQIKSESVMKSEVLVKSELDVKLESLEDKTPDLEAAEGTGATTPSDSNLGTDIANCDVKPGRKVWTSDELKQAFLPLLGRLYSVEPEAAPFRVPVDPVALCIPDYFEIVKKPMDLSTIRSKLDSDAYTDPWQVIDDIGLMFDNAWLYNRKTSKVYKYCTKLAEVFEGDIDPVMQSLGFCCGRRFVFTPQVLCCFGKQLCVIPRDSTYYNYLDRYIYCEKCFNELHGDEIEILDDPSNSGLKLKKDKFVKEKNDKLDPEPLVDCLDCGRRMHKMCALHMEQIWTSGFICDACRKLTGQKKKENKYTAKRLPPTKLGSYLEGRINSLLKRKAAGAGDVTVRVLSSYDKVVEVKPGMKARFVESGEMSETFPYRVKAIFAFEEIDGVDVCFFGMHVQEYGSDCPSSNARRVYIAYLDSVNFFQPRQFRTMVYHELLIGYMDYVKSLGFQMAHIWACPPSEGDDYIFYCHPPDMKIPKPKRLQEWYRRMLDKAICDHVIFDYKDILKDALDNNMQSVTELPYFEGDFWPNVLEESIKELNQEEEKRQREEEVAAADTDDGETADRNTAEMLSIAGKKRDQKSGKTKKKNPKTKKLSSRRSKSSGSTDLSARLLQNMEKHKEVFFVIRLQPKPADSELPDIKDPDPLMNNELMDGRDPFLTMAREKHYEFSSLRRAKFSTMAMLYELHMLAKDNFIYTCNNCKDNVETWYHCVICEDFDLCVICYRKLQHPHRMNKLGLDLDDGGQGDSKPQNPQEARRQRIQTYVQVLEHSCICRDANCTMASCRNMRKALAVHPKECRRKRRGNCATCKQLFTLCCYHAKTCREKRCLVPFCQNIKLNLEKQRQKELFQQKMLMRRRMALMYRAEDPTPNGAVTHDQGAPCTRLAMSLYSSLSGDGKLGQPPSLSGGETMFQPTAHPFPMMDEASNAAQQHQYLTPQSMFNPPCNPTGDNGGWVGTMPVQDIGQFQQQETFCHLPGMRGKVEAGVDGLKMGISSEGSISLERLVASEDKQKLVAVLKSNPRLMADIIAKLRQQEAVNQQLKHQQVPSAGTSSVSMMDGVTSNPMAPMFQMLPQQPRMNMVSQRQMMQMKRIPNGDNGLLMQHAPGYTIVPGCDAFVNTGSIANQSQLPHPGSAMQQDYVSGRIAGSRMPFAQARHILSPQQQQQLMMNHSMQRQPHVSVMAPLSGYSMQPDLIVGSAAAGHPPQPMDPSSVMCSLPSAPPPLPSQCTSSPCPPSNCSPLPHHYPPHYMNKVLAHSSDATSGGSLLRTGALGLQAVGGASGPNPMCSDTNAMQQLSFSPNGNGLEMANVRTTELTETMPFSGANSFSHFLNRK